MICTRCSNGIPENKGYWQHMWAGRLITTCYTCKPAPVRDALCGLKDSYYRPCVSAYGHGGGCTR